MTPQIRKGEPWGRPATGPPDVTVAGGDATLAETVKHHLGGRIAWAPTPESDFSRSVGSTGVPRAEPVELACDALAIGELIEGRGPQPLPVNMAVNMAVVGTAPDRQRRLSPSTHLRVIVDDRVLHDGPATAVLIANGEFLRGADLIPRGHPGDGRAEVQVYSVEPSQRRALRSRVANGTHVPHPGIRQGSGRRIEVIAADRTLALELDGVDATPTPHLHVTVIPEAFLLVV